MNIFRKLYKYISKIKLIMSENCLSGKGVNLVKKGLLLSLFLQFLMGVKNQFEY